MALAFSVIHNVVKKFHWRSGVWVKQLVDKIITVSNNKKKDSIILLCKDHLIDFYKGLGFSYYKTSSSNFGGYEWHEMSLNLPTHS